MGVAQPADANSKSASKEDISNATAHPQSAGVLGTHVSKLLPGSGETQLELLLLLSAAIFLLGLGALPLEMVPHPAAAALLARHRSLIAAGGLAALVMFVVSYFVT
jgi:hypothetical protein